MTVRERRETQGLERSGVHVAFEREEHSPAADVLVAVGVDAGVPAMSGKLVVGGGHELLALLAVLAHEDNEGRFAEIGARGVLPPRVEKAVVATELAVVLIDPAGAVVLDQQHVRPWLVACALDLEHGVRAQQPGLRFAQSLGGPLA